MFLVMCLILPQAERKAVEDLLSESQAQLEQWLVKVEDEPDTYEFKAMRKRRRCIYAMHSAGRVI